MNNNPIAFIDLKAQRDRIRSNIDSAIARVVDHGGFIMGPEIRDMEEQLAGYCGAKHCISCSNGTDALGLVLMAWGIGPGDAVFVPAFTFVSTAEVVSWQGATPVFVDVLDNSFNMDYASLEKAIEYAIAEGMTPKAVIPVDLFGQPAEYTKLVPIAAQHKLKVLADAAQSFGATMEGIPVGKFGDATSTSFFPAKPLGCYGDGGAVFTDNDELAERLQSLRVHGKGSNKYDNVRIGINGRMDTMQAAILIEKLKIFPDEIIARQEIADRYNSALENYVDVPRLVESATSVWAQYTMKVENRAHLQNYCKQVDVPTAVYYPIPLSDQAGYQKYPTVPGGVCISESLSKQVVSLPMHPYLDHSAQDRVIDAIRGAVRKPSGKTN